MVRILNWEKEIRFPKDHWNSIHTVVMVFESLYDSTILDLWDINWRLSSSMLLSVGYYNIWVTPWTHKHYFLVNACGNIQVYSYILLAFTNSVFTRTYLLTKKNKDTFSYKIKLTINTYYCIRKICCRGTYVTYIRAHRIWSRILTWNKTINWYKRRYENLYLISYIGHV